LDILVLILGLPLILPVMILVPLIIRLVSKGPVFFRQQRIGYSGKPFTVWKFRTMHVDADSKVHQEHVNRLIAQNLPLTKLDAKGDKRLIPFGRVLRASCLDEVPQLINVLRGEMSLVGPRPCMEYEYNQLLPWHKHRFDSPPGMTGLWQVKRGPETSFLQMMQMDLQYVSNRTLWLDLSILLETVPAVAGQVKNSWAAKRGHRKQREEHAI
jgi:lipopolysaccharide/colanic/teichoic acid biosynthesis glycosyltransferase